MIKAMMLIPERDNNGKEFSRSIWRALEQRLLPFGGYSRVDNVVGAWRHRGRIHRDVNHQFISTWPVGVTSQLG